MNDQVKLNFFASTPEACSYLQDRESVSAFANPHSVMDMDTYNVLIQHGFRRSAGYIYRPHCPSCNECVSVRIPVKHHIYSRSERRIIRKNSDLSIKPLKAKFKREHFKLYYRYINSRHHEGSMSNPSESDYRRFLICDWVDSIFFEYRLDGQLIAVVACDLMNNGLSAVYSFFDPDFSSRSMGHYMILSQIEQARSMQLDHLYLGYWIKDCDKMSYKLRYKPLQAYINEKWSYIN